MSHEQIAKELAGAKEAIVLIFAFNATERPDFLSLTKTQPRAVTANMPEFISNASEDLFVWDRSRNGETNSTDIRKSSLNRFQSLTEDNIRDKLNRFKPKLDRFDFIPPKTRF